MKKSLHTQKGFTLLLAALVSSIVLALGAAIYGLAVKEVLLSSLGRDSQFAFYAADTAAECALYWDIRFGYFGTTTPVSVTPPAPQCDTQSLSATGRTGTYPQTMSFSLEPNGYCADVTVAKTKDPTTGAVSTIIHANGYSTSCANQGGARTLQRSVELHY